MEGLKWRREREIEMKRKRKESEKVEEEIGGAIMAEKVL